MLLEGVAPELLQPPVSCMRLALHPDGMAPRIINLAEWRAHLLHRLERQLALTGDERVVEIRDEVLEYSTPPSPPPKSNHAIPASGDVMVSLKLRSEHGDLSFFSTVTTFGTAVDITVSELSIEAFFPADAQTAAVLTAVAASAD